MLSAGAPLWGAAVLLMLVALIVVNVVRLRRAGAAFAVWIGVAIGLVVAGVALLTALAGR